MRTSNSGLRESLLQQISQLVAITGHYITPYLMSIIDILKEYWDEHHEYVLQIVQQIAITTTESFTVYMHMLLPLLLSSISLPRGVTIKSFKSNNNVLKPLEQTLLCHQTLRENVRPHIHLVVPALCKLMNQLQELSSETVYWQTLVINTIKSICKGSKGALVEQCHVVVSLTVHTICRTIVRAASGSQSVELLNECTKTINVLGRQIGHRILPFENLIIQTFEAKELDISPYLELANAIRNGSSSEIAFMDEAVDDETSDQTRISQSLSMDLLGDARKVNWPSGVKNNFIMSPTIADVFGLGGKLSLNQQQLARAWDVSQRSTASDWHEWLWRFNVDLLRESPNPTLRLCSPLAQAHPAMARELFHAAFVSCWHELTEQYQLNLVRSLQTAFSSSTIPPEILQSLLNLAEFMEHDVEALPISLSILAELAQKGHAYAKALHYRELEFQLLFRDFDQKNNPAACFESLININKKLDQYDAASGLLKVVKQIAIRHPELKEIYTVQEGWLAKLGHWEEALTLYDAKLDQNPHDSRAIAGKLKCLDALGRWEEAIRLCEDNLDNLRVESELNNSNANIKAAVIGARAAWSLNQWSTMESFVSQLPNDNIDSSFMKAVLAVHQERYDESATFIDHTRKQLDSSMTALLTESYGRAYVPFIMIQQCSELEEIVEYKTLLKQAGVVDVPINNLSELNTNSDIVESDAATKTSSIANDRVSSALPRHPAFYSNTPRSPRRKDNISWQFNTKLSNTGDSSSSLAPGRLALPAEAVKRKLALTEKWRRRIRGCSSSGRAAIPFWKYLLNGRRMVLNEIEDLETWLDFVSLCRNNGNKALAERVLKMSHHAAFLGDLSDFNFGRTLSPADLSSNPAEGGSPYVDRRIKFAILKQRWSTGERHAALHGLEELIRGSNIAQVSTSQSSTSSYLRCLLKLGEWKVQILGPGVLVDRHTRHDVLEIYNLATNVDPSNYRAWHQWGLSNYHAVEETKSSGNNTSPSTIPRAFPAIAVGTGSGIVNASAFDNVRSYVVNAIQGLMRALTLGTRRWSSSITQDMLCVLSLWFRYGKYPEVAAAIEAGLSAVHIDNWLGVLPQLIARIDHADKTAKSLLHNLLIRLGAKHVQAMVYPLSVALKSRTEARKEAAESLMNSLRQHSGKLIDQALLVSRELVRVAILWEENWHWSLEEASRLYFGDGDTKAMLELLIPLHNALDEGPNSIREVSFMQSYGNELQDAWACLKAYMNYMSSTGQEIPSHGANAKSQIQLRPEDSYLHQAWDNYFAVFKKINIQLPQITFLELQSCSPALLNAKDMDLGVPGTYTVAGTAIRIQNFYSVVIIIRSKQRPRKMKMYGEDGQEFNYLLKVFTIQ